MGILTRFKWLLRPRSNGSGRLWDNTNTPGSKGWGAAPAHSNEAQAWPYANNFVPGPRPEPYLREGLSATDPRRLHASPRHLQPEIPVQEPRGIGQPTYINNTTPSTNIPQALPASMPIQAIAPPQTRQRELEYDAANPRTLQRFVFSHTPSQRYFDEKTPLPEFTTPATYTNQVIAGNNSYFPSYVQTGWEQSFVPEPGMRYNEVGVAPPTLLSRPLNVRTLQVQTGARQPLKAKAPKRKRTGG